MADGSGLRVIVLGYVVRGPLGGLSWHHLQYAMGLARLGHDVYFVEDSDDYPACYDPARGVTDTDPGYGLAYASRVFRRAGLDGRWAYHDAHSARWHGPLGDRAPDVCASADVLLNLSGVNPLRPWLVPVPARAFVDTDPVFTQIRHLTDPAARRAALAHTAFFTFGENVGREDCGVPDDGLSWRPTRQPVVPEVWPVVPGNRAAPFTTVMQWESYAAPRHDGRRYGMKSDSFAPYLELPARSGQSFELALGSPGAPRDLLRWSGWTVLDPLEPTRDPWIYQAFIQRSRAEFSVAKHGYVVTRSGWFSERSAAYLASGRPVLVQDTGFTRWLPSGSGVVAFRDPEEALAGVARITGDYERQSRDARAIVEEHFHYRRVLPALLEQALHASSAGEALRPAREDRR